MLHCLLLNGGNVAKTIKVKFAEWHSLSDRLQEEYQHKPSVLLIRTVMRRELGFTTREQWDWEEDKRGNTSPIHYMCLDFYDDQLEMFFRLKYL